MPFEKLGMATSIAINTQQVLPECGVARGGPVPRRLRARRGALPTILTSSSHASSSLGCASCGDDRWRISAHIATSAHGYGSS